MKGRAKKCGLCSKKLQTPRPRHHGAKCRICRNLTSASHRRKRYWDNLTENRKKGRLAQKKIRRTLPFKCGFLSRKKRAKEKRLPFTITRADLPKPTHCPALGIKLKYYGKFDSARTATIDKIIPALGYVPSNVAVLSHKANSIKRDATLQEIRRVANWLSKTLKSNP